MKSNLSAQELVQLIKTVFPSRPEDRNMAILVDVPDAIMPDNEKWRIRREMACEWFKNLQTGLSQLGLENISLLFYGNVHNNNADLPEMCFEPDSPSAEMDTEYLERHGRAQNFTEALAKQQIILAPTQFSTTAPLKVLAKKFGFRAATMPGFSSAMVPALRLDWQEINSRVNKVKRLLDEAESAEIEFLPDSREAFVLNLDLRFRSGHASGGLFPEPGTAGNLPSGESYIVPYEGEKGTPSRSSGIMPVQFGDELVKYKIVANKAVAVLSDGKISRSEEEKLRAEPAYGNLAELGFGVLRPFGIKPINEILLDEKLGLHIAFGRSDHFGGAVGVKNFTKPENVVHIDRIYINETQPRIHVAHVWLIDKNGERITLMQDGEYAIF